jgi:hypothetical protein
LGSNWQAGKDLPGKSQPRRLFVSAESLISLQERKKGIDHNGQISRGRKQVIKREDMHEL